MKKLLFILLLFNISLAAGILNIPKVKVIITMAVNNNRTEAWGRQSSNGFTTGLLYSLDSAGFIGSAEVSDFNFLENFSKGYLHRENNPAGDTDIVSGNDPFGNYFNNADKIVQYSFYPEKILSGDSLLNVYCKYILYEKKKEISANKINYDVSFYERQYTVPLNKKTSLDFLRKIFPNATTNEISFSIEKTKGNIDQPLLDLSNYKLSPNMIKESVKRDLINNSKLHLNLEYLQLNKKGNEIIVKKRFKCKSETNTVYSYSESTPGFPLNIYKGSISFPFQIFNPLKEQLYSKSKNYKDSQLKYSVLAIPLDKSGNTYTFRVLITRNMLEGGGTYSKKVKLEVGKRLRIDLAAAAGLIRTDETTDGQIFRLNTKEDFADYVNEYFIFTLNQ